MSNNTRNSTSEVCGTCQNWNGERKMIEKKKLNRLKQYVICSKKGYCDFKETTKNNDANCIRYQKWYDLDS